MLSCLAAAWRQRAIHACVDRESFNVRLIAIIRTATPTPFVRYRQGTVANDENSGIERAESGTLAENLSLFVDNQGNSGRFRSALSMRDELCSSSLRLIHGLNADGNCPEPVFRVAVRPKRARRFDRAGNPYGTQARHDSAESSAGSSRRCGMILRRAPHRKDPDVSRETSRPASSLSRWRGDRLSRRNLPPSLAQPDQNQRQRRRGHSLDPACLPQRFWTNGLQLRLNLRGQSG